MNSTDLYYKKLENKSVFLYDYCNSIIDNLSDNERENLEYYYNFQSIVIDESDFLKEPIIKTIHQQFEISIAGLIILEKNTGYEPHIDAPRDVAINMLISSGVSHSMFKTDEKSSKYQYKFKELIFEEKSFYLYNTSIEHSVINFDKPRYMFSLRFDDGRLTYNDVFNWCKENNLLEN